MAARLWLLSLFLALPMWAQTYPCKIIADSGGIKDAKCVALKMAAMVPASLCGGPGTSCMVDDDPKLLEQPTVDGEYELYLHNPDRAETVTMPANTVCEFAEDHVVCHIPPSSPSSASY
jgi:hypothetical protein